MNNLTLILFIFVIEWITNNANSFLSTNKKNDVIHIVFAVDEKLTSFCLIAMNSIVKNAINPNKLFFHLVLVDMYWDKGLMEELSSMLSNNNNSTIRIEAITWDPIPDVVKNMLIRGGRKDLASSANYARFYVSTIFNNSNIDRFIYLDDDIIAVNPIEGLWETDLNGNIFGMTEDCQDGNSTAFYETVIRSTSSPQYHLAHPVVRKAFNYSLQYDCYPNAGIMLVDEALFQKSNKLQQMEKLIALNQKEFIYRLGSQPLIVLAMWNRYTSLSNNYNFRSEIIEGDIAKDLVLLHYKGGSTVKTFMYVILENLNKHYILRDKYTKDQIVSVKSTFCHEIIRQHNLFVTKKRLLWCKIAIETYDKIYRNNMIYKRIQNLFQLTSNAVFSHLSTITHKHDNDTIHIVFALDQKLLSSCIISMSTIVQNALNPNRLFFHLVLVDMYWDKGLIEELSSMLSNNHNNHNITIRIEAITWNPIPDVVKNMLIRGGRKDLASPTNYARFYISSIFNNSNIDRFIYLDDNIIAVNPIEDLWRTDLNGNIYGLAHDCHAGNKSYFYNQVMNPFFKNQSMANYNLSHPIIQKIFNYTWDYSCYPNAGVMLVDEKLFHENQIQTQIEELIVSNKKDFVFTLGAQQLAVLTMWNKYTRLKSKYNYRARTMKDIKDLVLVHYRGDNELNSFMYIIFEYLKHYYHDQHYNHTYTNSSNHSNNLCMNNQLKHKIHITPRRMIWCIAATNTYHQIYNNNYKKLQELLI